MSVKSKPTKRKFYNKWLYKISLHVPGIYAFRYYGIADDNETLTNAELFQRVSPYISSTTRRKIDENQDLIVELSETLKEIPTDKWGMRTEGDFVDFYTNEKELFDQLSEKFELHTRQRFEPHSDPELFDAGVYVVNKYPFDQYRFKVFLQPHKFDRDKKKKKDFLKWLETQNEKVKLTDTTKEWFMEWNYNWDRRYMYVEDDKTLLMLKLRNPDALGKVYKYVLADK